MSKKKINISVIGSSGFIGQYLIKSLLKTNLYNISILVNKTKCEIPHNVKIYNGNINNIDVLRDLIRGQSIVINLVNSVNNSALIAKNLFDICVFEGVSKLIHLSSAEVYGYSSSLVINENTKCRPISIYQSSKKEFEDVLLKRKIRGLSIVILRPTVVFGIGGRNLAGFFNILKKRNEFSNFIYNSIFYYRKMNLISVNNVTDSIIFVCSKKIKENQILNLSEDDVKKNNYIGVLSLFYEYLGHKYELKFFKFKLFFTKILLILFRKSILSTNIYYDNSKILSLGFKRQNNFEYDLRLFIKHYLDKK